MDSKPNFNIIFLGNPGITKLLIDNGAQIDIRSSTGATPLHLAAEYGMVMMIFIVHECEKEVFFLTFDQNNFFVNRSIRII